MTPTVLDKVRPHAASLGDFPSVRNFQAGHSIGNGDPTQLIGSLYSSLALARAQWPMAAWNVAHWQDQHIDAIVHSHAINQLCSKVRRGRFLYSPAGDYMIDQYTPLTPPPSFTWHCVPTGQAVNNAAFPTNAGTVFMPLSDNMLVMDLYNAHHVDITGAAFNCAGKNGVTCVRLDSNNVPSLTHVRLRQFFLNDYQLGIQWGYSPLYVSSVTAGTPIRIGTTTPHNITLPSAAPPSIDPTMRYFMILPTVGGRALTNSNYVFPQVQLFGIDGVPAANVLCYAKYIDSTHFDLYEGYNQFTGAFSNPITGTGSYVSGSGYAAIIVGEQCDETKILDFFLRTTKPRAVSVWILSGNSGQQCEMNGGDIQHLLGVTKYSYGIAAPSHAGGDFIRFSIGGIDFNCFGIGSGPNFNLDNIESEQNFLPGGTEGYFIDNFNGVLQGIDMYRCVFNARHKYFQGNEIRTTGVNSATYEPELGPGAYVISSGDSGRQWPLGSVFRLGRFQGGLFPLEFDHGTNNSTSVRYRGSGVFGGGAEWEFTADEIPMTSITSGSPPIVFTPVPHLLVTGDTVFLRDATYDNGIGEYLLNGGPYKFHYTDATHGTLYQMDGVTAVDSQGFSAKQGYIQKRITSYAVVNYGSELTIPQWGKNGDILTFDRDGFVPVGLLCGPKWDVFRNFSYNYYGALIGPDNTTPAGLSKNTNTGRLETANDISALIVITAATNAAATELTTFVPLAWGGNRSVTISGFTGSWAAVNGHRLATKSGVSKFTVAVDTTTFGAMTGSPKYLLWDDLAVLGDIPISEGAYEPEGVVAAKEGQFFRQTNASDPDKVIWKKIKDAGGPGNTAGTDPTYGWYPLNYYNNLLPYPLSGGGVPLIKMGTGSLQVGALAPPIANAQTIEKWLGLGTATRTNTSTVLDVGAGESHFSDRVFVDNKLDIASDLTLTALTGGAHGKFLRLQASKIPIGDAVDLATSDVTGILPHGNVEYLTTARSDLQVQIDAFDPTLFVLKTTYDAHTHPYITGGGSFSGTDAHGDAFSGTCSTGSGNTGTHN